MAGPKQHQLTIVAEKKNRQTKQGC